MGSSRLQPPIINGTIPPFYSDILSVPFKMNQAVNGLEVKGFQLKIKTIQDNDILTSDTSIKTIFEEGNDINNILKISNIEFNINNIKDKLNIGDFYKIQIAYISNKDTVGYYSTVGIVKYTCQPEIEIQAVGDGKIYKGIYTHGLDVTEKIYSYEFILKDQSSNIVETSGEQIHNSSKDIDFTEQTDTYILKKELKKNQRYSLIYKIKTVNGLEAESAPKEILNMRSINSSLNVQLIGELNYEEGYIEVKTEGIEKNFNENKSVVGSFYLLRTSDEDNFEIWDEMFRFVLNSSQPNKNIWKDMTIKQGVRYKYAIQQYNEFDIRSNRIESEIIQADFEHSFLYDGERQLKIKYNPKVSSFKSISMLSKIETIGSKYPFIFKNGNINYKEFPIAGLISYLSDENNLFNSSLKLSSEEKYLNTDLISTNIFLEREFKLNVLNWLNNGQPKLFRSPVEGNYIVQLSNTSLTPTDALGRMLHSFTSTAHEIAENNYENLLKYNFIKANMQLDSQLRQHSVYLNGVKDNENLLKYTPANSIKLENLMPGEQIYIKFKEGNVEQGKRITIGATGSYSIDLKHKIDIYKLYFQGHLLEEKNIVHEGLLTYSYFTNSFRDSFDIIKSVKAEIVPCQQFVGAYDNILDEINNSEQQIESIEYIKFYLRDMNSSIYDDVAHNSEDLENSTKITINNSNFNIDLKDTFVYEAKNLEDIKSIKTGAAIVTEITYFKKKISYDENFIKVDRDAVKVAEDALDELFNSGRNVNDQGKTLSELQSDYKTQYYAYVEELKNKLESWEKGESS